MYFVDFCPLVKMMNLHTICKFGVLIIDKYCHLLQPCVIPYASRAMVFVRRPATVPVVLVSSGRDASRRVLRVLSARTAARAALVLVMVLVIMLQGNVRVHRGRWVRLIIAPI